MKSIKGIILAGGYGSRLYPLTLGTSKQLLPVYDKPMIYYPLSTLMLAGIREILIITTPEDLPRFKNLLSNGNQIGLSIKYAAQKTPKGIADSFLIAQKFIANNNVCLILGDNIFYAKNLEKILLNATSNLSKGQSTIFGVNVDNPNDFGVIEFDNNKKIKKIVEKPKKTNSKMVVSGLYYYTNDVIEIAKDLKPSSRGELEITDINNHYLKRKKLSLVELDSEISWIDTGTYNSLLNTSKFFQNLEKKSGNKFACIEEIALSLGYINEMQLKKIYNTMIKSDYGKYLKKLLK